jgi:hypothetical protein
MGQRIRRSVSTLSVRSKQGICWVGAVFRDKPEWRVGQIERVDSKSGRDEEFVPVFSRQINSGSATAFSLSFLFFLDPLLIPLLPEATQPFQFIAG